jgi:hypothetical protein
MLSRVAHIRLASEEVQRQVHASMPWGYKVANLLFRVRVASDAQAFGKLIYGMFLLHGVVGMPPVPKMPESIRQIDRLPRDYGLAFGKKAWSYLLRAFKTEEAAQEIMSIVSMEALQDKSMWSKTPGMELKSAESYILTRLKMRGINLMKGRKYRNHDSLDAAPSDEEETTALIDKVVDSGSAWGQLGEAINSSDMEEIEQQLSRAFRKIDPDFAADVDQYLKLVIDGYSDRQILINQMLPSTKVKPILESNWSKRYRPVIKDVLEDVLLGA